MTDENMNMNQNGSEISPPISPSLPRRYSTDSDYLSGSGKPDVNILQLLQTSPNLQRELVYLLEQKQQRGGGGGGGGIGYIDPLQLIASSGGDSFERELSNRLRLRRNLNDSLGSLTDSDFYNSDVEQRQSKLHGLSYTNGGSNNVKDDVAISLTRVGRLLDMLSNLPWPRMSFTAMGICFLIATFISPRACVQNILFPTFRLVFGTLYPAYASYKAVRTKNVKEYVKWMMYWIVFAFFTCIETFTDIFLSWLPLYYEVKVIVVLWLLNPATKGSSVLYRKFVHPMLTRREQEIDEYLNQAKERGYTAVIQLGSKGVNYATNVIMQTALKGGGNLVQTIKRSYSLSDLSEPDIHRTQDEVDELTRPQHRGLRPRAQAQVGRSSSSGARHSTGMYFSEIDVGAKGPVESLHYNIKSTDDISSGYSSAEPIPGGLSRTSSMTSSKGLRFRAKKPEDEKLSEYDENEYLIREDILSQLNLKRSQSLNEPVQIMPEHSSMPVQNSLIKNSYGLEDNLGLNSSKTVLDGQKKDEIEVNNGKVSTNFIEDKISNDNVDKNEILITTQMDAEMQSKYEMFRKWLEQGEVDDKVIKNESKVEMERQISDEDFKDTISVGSNEDNTLEKFDDAICAEVKPDDLNCISVESTGKEQNSNIEKLEITSLPSSAAVKEITEQTNVPKSDPESLPIHTLKENISIAVDSVTRLKEHILKLNDGNIKMESELLAINQTQSLNSNLNNENLDEINITEAKIDNLTETKKPVHHSKGKAPEPPAILSTSNLPTPYTDLFKPISLFESFKPIPPPRPPSPKISSSNITNIDQIPTTLNTNTRPASPLLPPLTSFSSPKGSPSPISSRPSSPNTTSSSVLSSPEQNAQLQSSSKISSHSRSPSPKPAIKPRRNIFRSYLPSFLRSESPKSKADEEYPGKETEI